MLKRVLPNQSPHQLERDRCATLQLERIDAYAGYLDEHPRGDEISRALQEIFLHRGPRKPQTT